MALIWKASSCWQLTGVYNTVPRYSLKCKQSLCAYRTTTTISLTPSHTPTDACRPLQTRAACRRTAHQHWSAPGEEVCHVVRRSLYLSLHTGQPAGWIWLEAKSHVVSWDWARVCGEADAASIQPSSGERPSVAFGRWKVGLLMSTAPPLFLGVVAP